MRLDPTAVYWAKVAAKGRVAEDWPPEKRPTLAEVQGHMARLGAPSYSEAEIRERFALREDIA